MASAIPAFYNAALVNIWVEDPLTRDYLTAVWPLAPFHYIVAGGIAGAKAMAKRAADDHLAIKVFAIVDRDLGSDNEAKWADPAWTGVEYRARVLEVENFLLDEASIAAAAGNAARKSDTDILRLFVQRAEALKWWMTCKRVLAEVTVIRNKDFPADNLAHPDRPDGRVTSEDAAVKLLHGCDWTAKTLPATVHEVGEAQLRARVQAAHADVAAWLAGNEWRDRFSGKELFNWIYGQVSSGSAGTRPASMESLAAEVGAIQLAAGRVHPSLTALEASIRRRAGV